MKTLLILRHAKSSWKEAGLSDHDRPLNARGKHDAPRMGKLIAEKGLVPDLILSSTAKRARKTAKKVAAQCGYDADIRQIPDLYLASPQAILKAIRGVPDGCRRVMVVGHNPGLEEFLEVLTERAERLPTAALAEVDVPIEKWCQLDDRTRGDLRNYWLPRELP